MCSRDVTGARDSLHELYPSDEEDSTTVNQRNKCRAPSQVSWSGFCVEGKCFVGSEKLKRHVQQILNLGI